MGNCINPKENDEKSDIVTELIGYPHILTDIFSAVSHETLVAAEEVSPSWKNIISLPSIWRNRWMKATSTTTVSPTWKVLATRMEHRQVELLNRIKGGDCSAYQEAVNYIEGNIRQILDCSVQSSRVFTMPWHNCFMRYSLVKVDHRYIYIGFPNGMIKIINRWTRDIVHNLNPPGSDLTNICGLQLSDRHLATKFNNGTIVIYNRRTFQIVQTIREQFYAPYRYDCGGFNMTNDTLVNVTKSKVHLSMMITLRKFNDATGVFGPDTENTVSVDFQQYPIDMLAYFSENYIIAEALFAEKESDYFERTVQVFDTKSLEVVRQRSFNESCNSFASIKKECIGGTIVAFDAAKQRLVAWNLEDDTVQPIMDHPEFSEKDVFIHSAAIDHRSDYQLIISRRNGKIEFNICSIAGRRCIENCSLKKVQSKTFDENSSMKMMKILKNHLDYSSCNKNCYFDGVQLIFKGKRGLHIFEFND